MTEWSAVLASSLGRHPGAGRGPGVFVWFNCQELLSSYNILESDARQSANTLNPKEQLGMVHFIGKTG